MRERRLDSAIVSKATKDQNKKAGVLQLSQNSGEVRASCSSQVTKGNVQGMRPIALLVTNLDSPPSGESGAHCLLDYLMFLQATSVVSLSLRTGD